MYLLYVLFYPPLTKPCSCEGQELSSFKSVSSSVSKKMSSHQCSVYIYLIEELPLQNIKWCRIQINSKRSITMERTSVTRRERVCIAWMENAKRDLVVSWRKLPVWRTKRLGQRKCWSLKNVRRRFWTRCRLVLGWIFSKRIIKKESTSFLCLTLQKFFLSFYSDSL